MALVLDERIPLQLLEIREPSRQQIRRALRGHVPCIACRGPLTADDCCFADGQDAHRHCAEEWNQAIFEMAEKLDEAA